MRMGAKKKPFYRIVVKEKRSKRDGKYLENLGTYNPMMEPAEINLKHERIQYWISVGAPPTETVASLIKHNPVQTEEEKAAAVEARAAKAEAERKALADARKAAAEAKRAEEEKAAAEKAEAERAAAAEAESENTEATETAETEASADAPAEETPAASE
jgi:small subunit ribosomal protein S16